MRDRNLGLDRPTVIMQLVSGQMAPPMRDRNLREPCAIFFALFLSGQMAPPMRDRNRIHICLQWHSCHVRADGSTHEGSELDVSAVTSDFVLVRADGSTHEGSERLAGMEDVFPYELRKAVPGCVTLRKMVFVQEAPDGAAASG